MSIAALGAPAPQLVLFFRVELYACGRTLYRLLHRYAALADFAGLLLIAFSCSRQSECSARKYSLRRHSQESISGLHFP